MKREINRQLKIKSIFESEKRENPSKCKEIIVKDTGSENVKIEKIWFPRLVIEKHTEGSTDIYSMYETNTQIYFPLEERYLDLCLEFGCSVFSRTLRIFKKKKALRKILKQREKPEGWEDKVEELNNSILKIYNSGKTINLNLLR